MIKPKYEKSRRRDSSKSESKLVYAAVTDRSRGMCEYCTTKVATQMHHRKYRSRGGLDTVTNVIHLCVGCHSYAHSGIDAAVEGLAVSSWEDPAQRAVWYRGRVLYLLPGPPWIEERKEVDDGER